MGAVDAKFVADYEPSIVDQNLTATEDGAAVDVTNSRGEAALINLITQNTSGDLTIEVQEKDPGGSFSAVADADLDFSASNQTTNGFTLSGASSGTKEVIGYTGDAAELRIAVTGVANTPDYEVDMGILQYLPRQGGFNT